MNGKKTCEVTVEWNARTRQKIIGEFLYVRKPFANDLLGHTGGNDEGESFLHNDDVNMLDIDSIVDSTYPLNISHAGGEFNDLLGAGIENR